MIALSKPHYRMDLAGLQAVCDANYARLCRLMPDMEVQDERCIRLHTPDDNAQRLVMRVLERCPYTTTLQLRHEHQQVWLPPPGMEVRLYHDVNMAEVVAAYNRRRFRGVYPYPNEQMLQPDEKYQLNRFLGEWLEYCQRHGLSDLPVLSRH